MNKYILSYISPSTEGQWWMAAEIMESSRRRAIQRARVSHDYIFESGWQWRVTRSDK